MRGEFFVLLDDTVLNVYGHDLMIEASQGAAFLSGTLLDGTNVTGYEMEVRDSAQVILHNVPEPAALGLAVVAVAAVLVAGGRFGVGERLA